MSMTMEEEEEDGGACISLKSLRIPHSACAHLFIDGRDFLGEAKRLPASFSSLSTASIAAGLPRLGSHHQHSIPFLQFLRAPQELNRHRRGRKACTASTLTRNYPEEITEGHALCCWRCQAFSRQQQVQQAGTIATLAGPTNRNNTSHAFSNSSRSKSAATRRNGEHPNHPLQQAIRDADKLS